MNIKRSNEKGFTLIEMLVVMLVVGLLASIAVPAYLEQTQSGTKSIVTTFMKTSEISLVQARTEGNGSYPAQLPAEVQVPPEIKNLSYTTSATRDAFCLALEFKEGAETRYGFINGTPDGEIKEISTSCIFENTGSTKLLLEGLVKTDGTANLFWNEVPEATRYDVYAKENNTVARVGMTTTERWTSDQPIAFENEFYVIPITAKGAGEKSNTIILAPFKVKPSIAPSVSLTNYSATPSVASATVSWTSVPWAEYYEAYDASTGAVLWAGTTPQARSFNASAKVGASLSIYVVAFNDVGKSPNSNVVTLTGPKPGAANVTASIKGADDSSGRTYSYTWQDVPGASRYAVYLNNTLVATINDLAGSTNTWEKKYGWNTGIHSVHVIPITASGMQGTPSNVSTFNSALASPAAPTITVTANNSTQKATSTWNTPTNTKSFKFEYKKHSTGATSATTGTATAVNNIAASTTSRTDTLTYGDTIYVRVAAVGWGGTSAWSNWVSAKVAIPAPTFGTVTRTVSGSTANATCPAGLTVQLSSANNAGQTAMKSFTSWANGTPRTISFTQSYGQKATVNWKARCAVTINGSLQVSSEVTNSGTAPQRTITAPKATSWSVQDGGYNKDADRMVLETKIHYPSESRCPSGTTLEHRRQVQYWNYDTPNSWESTWMTASSLSETQWRKINIGWGNWFNIRFESRCKAGNYISPTTVTSWKKREATMDKPTKLTLHTDTYRTAKWSATCYVAASPQYKWRKYGGAFQYALDEWTTKKEYARTGTAWGNGTHKIWVRCKAGMNSNVSPTATKEVDY